MRGYILVCLHISPEANTTRFTLVAPDARQQPIYKLNRAMLTAVCQRLHERLIQQTQSLRHDRPWRPAFFREQLQARAMQGTQNTPGTLSTALGMLVHPHSKGR